MLESFPETADGHRSLASWMCGFGTIEGVGIEGTGAYGLASRVTLLGRRWW